MIILKLKPIFLNDFYNNSFKNIIKIAVLSILLLFYFQNSNAQNIPKKEEKKDDKKEEKTVILKENLKNNLKDTLKEKQKNSLKNNQKKDTILVKKAKKPFPNPFKKLENIRVGINALGLGLSFTPKQPLFIEANIEAEFGKWLANIDIGTYTNNQTYQEINANRQLSVNYNNQAFFFKLGGDYNVIKKSVKKHLLFFGFRYAHASFTENIQQEKSDTLFGVIKQDLTNKVSANWLEATFGMKVNVWKNLYVGYTLRYKTALWTSGSKEFALYDVPAFGKPSKNANASISYYIWYCFPVKKRK